MLTENQKQTLIEIGRAWLDNKHSCERLRDRLCSGDRDADAGELQVYFEQSWHYRNMFEVLSNYSALTFELKEGAQEQIIVRDAEGKVILTI